jgi:hypothetical protein
MEKSASAPRRADRLLFRAFTLFASKKAMMNTALRSYAKQHFPAPLLFLATNIRRRVRPSSIELWDRRNLAELSSINHVQSGPFRGMKFIPISAGSMLAPKLLGTYELEIQHLVEDAIAREPDLIIDVGTAEGYYAVGLALRLPETRVVGFDTDRRAQHLLARMAKLNRIGDRLDIRGECTPAALNTLLGTCRNPLIVCDCEGYEDMLLDPAAASNLSRASILAELHDCYHPTVSERIARRFAPTHDVQTIKSRPRTMGDYPLGVGTTDRAIDLMNEVRPSGMNWQYMLPRG